MRSTPNTSRRWENPPSTKPGAIHFVEARFELGENAAASPHKGDAVIVTGREHTSSSGEDANKQYGRVIDADSIGADLARATVTISRNTRDDQQ